MRLRAKLTLINICIVVLSGFVTLIAISYIMNISINREIETRGESIGRLLADIIANDVVMNEYFTVSATLNDIKNNEELIEYIFVTDISGNYYAGTFMRGYPKGASLWNEVSLKTSSKLLLYDGRLIRDIGIKVFDGTKSDIHVGLKLDRILSAQVTSMVIISFTVIFGIILTILFYFLINIWLIKPLEKLNGFADKLTDGGYGAEVLIESKDEIGSLASSFNRLSVELLNNNNRINETFHHLLRTEKLTALGQLSAEFAHEIKNPLAAIRSLLQVMQSEMYDKEDINILLKEVNNIDSLINIFLRHSKKTDFVVETTDISQVIIDILKLFKNEFLNKKINIETDIPPKIYVAVNKTVIEQAILNMVMNSVEALSTGGELSIRLERREDSNVVINITDNGCGIADDIKEKIFLPFFTTKPTGTGLGLSIVQKAMEMHNGKITVASSTAGTTFELILPEVAHVQNLDN